MKNQRIYTLFLLPNGDKIPLSFRCEKSLNNYIREHSEYELLRQSDKPLFNKKLNVNDIHRLLDYFYSFYSPYLDKEFV